VPARGLRPLVVLAIAGLFVLLPALVAGASIDQPVRAAEQARLEPPPGAPRSIPAELFYRSMLPDPPPAQREQSSLAVFRARLASVGAIAAIALATFLLVGIARSRVTGLLACAALALLPPVAIEGALLRPEPAAVLAGLVGVLLLAALAQVQLRAGAGWRRALPFLFAASVAFGFAATILPSAGLFLLVPLGVFCLAFLLGASRLRRLLRRRPLERLQIRGWSCRQLVWLAAVLGAGGATWLFQSRYVHGDLLALAPSVSELGLLPEPIVARAPLLLLALLGAASLARALLRRLLRRRRVDPLGVLVLFVAVVVLRDGLTREPIDRLAGAVGVAILVAEGGLLLLRLAIGRLLRAGATAATATPP
jgi:hypothetical protein